MLTEEEKAQGWKRTYPKFNQMVELLIHDCWGSCTIKGMRKPHVTSGASRRKGEWIWVDEKGKRLYRKMKPSAWRPL